jgi:hypothetical protein
MDINIFLHTLLVLYIVKDQQPLGLERENIGLGNIYIYVLKERRNQSTGRGIHRVKTKQI